MSKKINTQDLSQLIEMQKRIMMESVNAAGVKDLISAVTDLYDEIGEFESSAPRAAINALTPHLRQVKETLEQMIENPMSYIEAPQKEKTRVVLKPTEQAEED